MVRLGDYLPEWLKWVISISVMAAVTAAFVKSSIDDAKAERAGRECLQQHPSIEERKP